MFSVILRAHLQQPVEHLGVQEQRPVRDQQKEPDVLQGMSTAQVSGGGDVKEWIALRPPLQLVQDSLPAAGAVQQQQHHPAGKSVAQHAGRDVQGAAQGVVQQQRELVFIMESVAASATPPQEAAGGHP